MKSGKFLFLVFVAILIFSYFYKILKERKYFRNFSDTLSNGYYTNSTFNYADDIDLHIVYRFVYFLNIVKTSTFTCLKILKENYSQLIKSYI